MEPQHLINFMYTALLAIGGFIVKSLWTKQEKNSEDLASFREHVAREYPSRESIEKRLDKMDDKLDKLIAAQAND